jgi:hypothetical protein
VFCVLIAALLANANWDVSLRTEARGGTVPNAIVTKQSDTTAVVGSEAGGVGQVDASLGVSGDYEDLTYSASWQPHYLRATVVENQPDELLNSGRLGLVYRVSSLTRITFGESFAYGVQDFSPLVACQLSAVCNVTNTGAQSTAGNATTQRVVVKLVYLNQVSNLGFDTALSHLVKLNVAASYFITGGADHDGREALPLQHGLTLTSGLGWTATREDVFSATLAATATNFNPAQRSETGALQLGWRRSLNDRTGFDVGLGFGAGAAQGGAQPEATSPFPVASAGITHTIPLRTASVSGGLHATLTPAIDPVTGAIYELLQGNADLSWSPATVLRFSGHVGYGRALSSQYEGQDLLSGDVSGQVALNTHTTFSIGARAARDYFPAGLIVTNTDPNDKRSFSTLQAFQRFDWAVYAAFAFNFRGPL